MGFSKVNHSYNMFNSIYQDVKDQLSFGNNITRIIVINAIVFVLLYIVFAIIALTAGPDYLQVQNKFIAHFMLPPEPINILKHPWTIVTHMFLHRGFFHLFWNMLILYWFGRIFGDLMGDQRVVPLYLLGGLMGVVFIQLGFLLGISVGPALGASAAVMALVIGSAIVAPDYNINLILIGAVKLKYIALAMIVFDLIGIANVDNTGGHFGHIGGMVMGWLFIVLIQNGNDPSVWFNKTWESITALFSGKEKTRKSPLKVRHKATVTPQSKSNRKQEVSPKMETYQNKLDMILDKISKKGISSLSKDEKQFLDEASKND